MRIEAEFKGQVDVVEAEWIAGRLWYHWRGETRVWEPSQRRGRGSGEQIAREVIVAPMPGKVTKILRQIGDPIQAGDLILVMEAMKMEYSLRAEVAGRIGRLECQVGEQVSLGKKLAQIETESEAGTEPKVDGAMK
ncbi:MAG: acetyl-CoA carboxylase biotin carboxyl carrier protein subunit [Bdellovibrio sp.]|nr:MAG: acetyl-CoA carboxylase biotin carboxyl carrier protein subunit [Bdellovibrio sp.]